jgi:predicted amidohydrolase YtcJ
MRNLLRNLPKLLVALLLANSAMSAELVLKNGRFYTVDVSRPWVEAVAIEDGHFVYVGDVDGVSEFVATDTAVHDLEGRFVLPGLIDSHTHPGLVALIDSHTHPGLVARSVDYVDLPWTPETKQEMFDVLVAYAEANPEKDFIVGGRWPTALFGEEGPNRQELDAVIADRPVILKDTSGHAQWLNTRALEILGIDRDTPDPIPGLSYLYRDADGEPTGWIKERAIDKQLAAAGIGGISTDSLAGGNVRCGKR